MNLYTSAVNLHKALTVLSTTALSNYGSAARDKVNIGNVG